MNGSFPHRGEIYLVSLRTRPARRKVRPVLVVSPDVRNRWASDILAAPISTHMRPAPTHVLLDRGEGGLPHASVVKCEQITCLDKTLLGPRPLGRPLSPERMRGIERALLISLGVFTSPPLSAA
ncbi:MAG: type II toxin-antitoxin system PemK/MazF family toxin [candidate division NC10 bacterium]|nr:type II toxin-antitoxin system PemK/MazF family toxin [candidate division NC10 bacterium]